VRIVLATANPDKAAEIEALLGGIAGLEVVPRPASVPDVEETGATLEANALLKARAVCAATGEVAVADDTGLEVDALDGAPGVRSARYAGEGAGYDDNVAKLLGALERAATAPEGRRARFRTVAAARFPSGRELVAEGAVAGAISAERRGTHGFGYDPVFVPDDGDGRTFAEMTPAEKQAISHRARAFTALASSLLGALKRA
jgi:XTP/dITP diphosphohydrolase